MSLLTKLTNKIEYQVNSAVSDPKADEYAKQQEKQKKQDEAIKKREADKLAKEEETKKKAEEEKAKQEDIKKRSKFNVNELISDAARYVFIGIIVLGVLAVAFYGGTLAANEAIGYSIPNRLLSFFYGALMCWYLVPKALYETIWLNKSKPYYTFLPLIQYEPQGLFEQAFIGPFAYKEDEAARAAQKAVKALYEKGSSFTEITMNQPGLEMPSLPSMPSIPGVPGISSLLKTSGSNTPSPSRNHLEIRNPPPA